MTAAGGRRYPSDRVTVTHGTCRGAVFRACPSCSEAIRGADLSGMGLPMTDTWKRPDFCRRCSAPFPWASRAARIRRLVNLVEAEDLDPATELAVREQLNALADLEVDDKAAERRWRRVRELAPGLWEQSGARSVLITVMSEAAKRAVGL
ncbi:MAG: DUF2321 domain-containing protein [Candidatus Limnocylindria bacterium]